MRRAARDPRELYIRDDTSKKDTSPAARRVDVWLPVAYAVGAGAWIAFSDLLLSVHAASPEAQTTLSIVKGLAFVAVTAIGLHVALSWAYRRERRAYQQLERSEALFRDVTDSIADPVFLKDRESRWLFANPAALRAVGLPAGKVLGHTDAEIYADPAVGRELMANDRRVIETGVAEVVEEIVLTPQGRRVFLSSKAPYRDAAGDVVGVIGNAQDITDRKDRERALREQFELKDQIAKIAASVPGLICSFRVGTDGRASMPFATSAIQELYGLHHEEVANDIAPWAANLHPDDAQRVSEEIARVAASQTPWHDVFRYHHPAKGWRWIEGWSVPRSEPDGSVVFHGFVMDVTEIHRMEQRLQDAARLESIGRLAGGVAHDFNNLLTVILSCTEQLKEAVASGERADPELVSDIDAAAESARTVTGQLLAFARRQVSHRKPVDVNALVGGAEKLLRRLLGEHVQVAVRLAPGLWTVRADTGQLEQVILNLAVNARDAMPEGGRLVIETSNVDLREEDVAADPSMRTGSFVRILVRDSGRGMPADVREHAFEPFYTTKPSGRGTGLGLAMVHGIVAQNDGFVLLDSEPGQGTTFEIYLPRMPDAASRVGGTEGTISPGAPHARPPGQDRAEAVLVVEDDPQVRAATVRALTRAGLRVVVACSGREALDLDEGLLANTRLLVTDVVMPGMGGRALANELRARNPGMRVLFVSGYTEDAFVSSNTDFLPKPFTATALVGRVQEILARA